MRSQSGVVTNEARKSDFFQPTKFRNSTDRAWNGQKNCQLKGFWCKKLWGIHWSQFQSSISCRFGRNWQFIQLTLRTAPQKKARYYTLRPLNPLKTWFEAPKLLLKDCPPLVSNTYAPPPFFSLLATSWPLSLTHYPAPWGSTTPFHSVLQPLFDHPLQNFSLQTRPIGPQIITGS